jgi:RimJ/RimL family protein N-acetyltransferase
MASLHKDLTTVLSLDLSIRTQRLVLRPFEASDARRVSYLAGDYEVSKMCGRVPHPYRLEDARDWIATQGIAADAGEEFRFAITLPRDGLIGSCGVTRVRDRPGVWELGYWFGLPYWGSGYASEAAAAVMDWARNDLGARGFVAHVFADNPGSGRVLGKLGFVREDRVELFALARQRTGPVERYVWPAGAVAANDAGETAH